MLKYYDRVCKLINRMANTGLEKAKENRKQAAQSKIADYSL